jgi:hypothetical protein
LKTYDQPSSSARVCAPIRTSLSSFAIALILGAAAQPARAEPLITRLDPRLIASVRSRSSVDWRDRRNDFVVSGDQKSRGPLSLIVLGGGVVAGGVATFFGVRNHSAWADYNAAQTAAARTDARSRAQSSATVANVSWIASGVLLAAGLGMLFFTDI